MASLAPGCLQCGTAGGSALEAAAGMHDEEEDIDVEDSGAAAAHDVCDVADALIDACVLHV